MTGKVYLIGGGPGDPGLITARGLELLRQAQVVVYDRLISPRLLSEAPKRAEFIDAGKETGRHALTQEAINAVLVEKARSGKRVVRLKGGDPFLYGRGGEEAEALAAAGVPFEVVPGVSSAIAVAAYAGIPVTHRQLSSGLRVMTGHRAKELSQPNVEPRDTVVALMAASRLPEVVRELIEEGWRADTPSALIERGTTARQRTVVTVLENVVATARDERIEAPAILVVGEVVALRDRIRWAEARPLAGLRALALGGDNGLGFAQRLESLGAECQWTPVEEPIAPRSWQAVDTAVADLDSYSTIVFLTRRDVEAFLSRLQRKGRDLRALAGRLLATTPGEAADALAAHGLRPDVLPRGRSALALATALKAGRQTGALLLVGQGSVADDLTRLLAMDGISTTAVRAYATGRPVRLRRAIASSFAERPDIVVLRDGASVAALADAESASLAIPIATVGTDAKKGALKAGLRPVITARDMNTLVEALVGRRRAPGQSAVTGSPRLDIQTTPAGGRLP